MVERGRTRGEAGVVNRVRRWGSRGGRDGRRGGGSRG